MEIKRSRQDGRSHSNGYHTLEKMCLPNGDYASVLIWNEKKNLKENNRV